MYFRTTCRLTERRPTARRTAALKFWAERPSASRQLAPLSSAACSAAQHRYYGSSSAERAPGVAPAAAPWLSALCGPTTCGTLRLSARVSALMRPWSRFWRPRSRSQRPRFRFGPAACGPAPSAERPAARRTSTCGLALLGLAPKSQCLSALLFLAERSAARRLAAQLFAADRSSA